MEKRIWNFLKENGFNDFAIAGLMGNLFAESGLISTNLEITYNKQFGLSDAEYTKRVDDGTYTNFVNDKAGYGLAQWTFWTRKQNLLNFAKNKNKSIGDLEMQLEFLIKELKEQFYTTVYCILKNATSVQQASDAVLMDFERPYNAAAQKAKRAAMGQVYYDKYSKSTSNSMEDKEMKEYKKGQRTQISQNFSSTEFDCHGKGCCSVTNIDPKLVEYLQQIRKHFGKPVTVTSAYRCETHNKNEGGATKSYHVRGQAADIVVSGTPSREVAKYAESIGILGIGLYETQSDGYFTHIDTRTTKSFWYGQKQQPRSTFGGSSENSAPVSTNPKPNTQGAYHKSINKYAIKLIYLQKGDRGKDVQILQGLLGIHGYNIETNGEFDAATYKAVVDFQKKVKVPADGIVGAQTMEKLLTA